MSDDELSIPQRIKTSTFSMDERKLLLKLINKYYNVVNNKKNDSKTTQEKNQAWESIQEEFSASSIVQFHRSPQQLKRCWENLRCKAKKGDASAHKLLRWAENQYQIVQKNNEKDIDDNKNYDSTSLLDQDSDCSLSDKDVMSTNAPGFLDSIESSLQDISSADCPHCQCDKIQRVEKLRLIKYEKQQLDRVYNTKIQNLREKSKRDKELHKLAVHEMTLRVENERRRAEILDKELSLQTY